MVKIELETEINPHAQFCCLTHGCRFNNHDLCPVAKGQIAQINKCGESTICSEYMSDDLSEIDDQPYEH